MHPIAYTSDIEVVTDDEAALTTEIAWAHEHGNGIKEAQLAYDNRLALINGHEKT